MVARAATSDSAAWSGSRSSAGRTLAWVLGIAGTSALLVLLGLGGPASPAPYFGTRLGMSETAVRRRFEPAASGSWSSTGPSDAIVLRWTPAGNRAGLPEAVVFEFNEGKVVAIRADLDGRAPLALGPPLESSFASVVARQPEGDGKIRLTVLSRTCSKHVGEAAALMRIGSFARAHGGG